MKKIDQFNPDQKKFDALSNMVQTSKENACRDALVPFCKELAHRHGITADFAFIEFVSHGGTRSDLLICGSSTALPLDQRDKPISMVNKKVVLYECKSPESPVLKKAKGARFHPSNDLLEAESQIVEYLDKIKKADGNLRDEILSTNIRYELGGVIIGRSQEISQDQEIFQAYERKRDNNTIPIYTWDEILEWVSNFNF